MDFKSTITLLIRPYRKLSSFDAVATLRLNSYPVTLVDQMTVREARYFASRRIEERQLELTMISKRIEKDHSGNRSTAISCLNSATPPKFSKFFVVMLSQC
jgi:hypothetical protein